MKRFRDYTEQSSSSKEHMKKVAKMAEYDSMEREKADMTNFKRKPYSVPIKSRILILIAIMLFIPVIQVKAAENTYLSEEIQEACIKHGEEYNICPELLMAIIEKESRGNPDVENGSCKGLMQINIIFQKDRMKRIGVKDIFSVDGNIHLGADYLAELISENDDVYYVLMAYNMGSAKAKKLYEQDSFSRYAVSVSNRAAEIERAKGE